MTRLCNYGCGQEAKYKFKSGNWCCSDSHNKCPANKQKNSENHLGDKNIIRQRPELKDKIRNTLKGRTFIDLHGEEKAREIKEKIRKNRKFSKKERLLRSIRLKENNPMSVPIYRQKMINNRDVKGSKNGSWKGGVSNDPYCPIFSNKEFREIIYYRDRNNCQICGITKHLNFKLTGNKVLTIHHINHNKKDCSLFNCITVCVSCNNRVEKRNKYFWYEKALWIKTNRLQNIDIVYDNDLYI